METQPLHEFGTEKQILFDDALVADNRGFQLTMNPAVRAEQPAVVADRPWEAGGASQPSVAACADGRHRMWYYSTEGRGGSQLLCYAESADGVEWEKPDLGVCEYEGSTKNNIAARGIHAGVFEDPHDVPERRYKLIGSDGTKWGVTSVNCGGARFRYYTGELETWEYQGVTGAHSPDGIHWTKYDGPIMPWYTDTHNVAFWDDGIGRYVAYVRWNDHLHVNEEGRQVGSFDYRSHRPLRERRLRQLSRAGEDPRAGLQPPRGRRPGRRRALQHRGGQVPPRRRRLPDLPLGLPPHQRHPRHPAGDEPRRHRLRPLARSVRAAGADGPLRLAVPLHGARPRSPPGTSCSSITAGTRTGTTSTSTAGNPGGSAVSASASTASSPTTPKRRKRR